MGALFNYKGPIKDTKRTRGRLDRNVAPCSRPTINVIGTLHECKKVCPCPTQGFEHEWSKEKERKRDRKDRGQEADGKKGRKTKQKHIGGTKTRPTYSPN